MDPDCIVVLPCGYALAPALEQARAVFATGPAARLHAACAGRAFVADGNQYFNRPGPRLVESAEILAEIFASLGPDTGAESPHRVTGAWTPLTPA